MPNFIRTGFVDPSEAERVESMLAKARLILAVATLAALYIYPTEPARDYVVAAFLLVAYVLYSISAHSDKRLRAENAVILGASARAQAEFGSNLPMEVILEGAMEELRRFQGATSIFLIVVEETSRRCALVRYEPEGDAGRKLQISEITADEQSTYLPSVEADAWSLVRSKEKVTSFLALDEQGKHLPKFDTRFAESFAAMYPCKSLLASNFTFGKELSGRLVVYDPSVRQRSWEGELKFLQRFTRQVTPAICNVYLQKRLEEKVAVTERERIARDLHDGILQSLTGMALHIEALQYSGGENIDILRLIRGEIKSLRVLIQELSSFDLRPEELLPLLVEYGEKFQRDTGILARVVSDNQDIALPPRVCREIAGIVREALTNVRKHSEARNVLVRFSCSGENWDLLIEDDGRGFDFAGNLSQAELDKLRKGPVVIKERVRLLRGEISVESRPGNGSRLKIIAPAKLSGTQAG